jgi:membrane-associated phospholipid phosphatase
MKEESRANAPRTNTSPYFIGLIIGIVLFVATLLIARTHEFSGWQLQLFRAFNDLPNGLRLPALWITEGLGAAYPIILCALIPALYKRFRLAWRFAVAGIGSVVGLEIGKIIAHEPRPVVLLHGQLHQRAVEPGLTSFPSGHMAAATALALVLWAILPRQWRWLSIVWILIMAASRLYLGVHTPNDLVGGFAIGLMVVCVIWLLPRSIAKPLHLDNDEPLTDPGW